MPMLQHLPGAGIWLNPAYTTDVQEAFIMKVTGKHLTRDHVLASYMGEGGKPGRAFVEVDHGKTTSPVSGSTTSCVLRI